LRMLKPLGPQTPEWEFQEILLHNIIGNYTVKKVNDYHVPSRVVTNRALSGRE
jgi:hypothetical protein